MTDVRKPSCLILAFVVALTTAACSPRGEPVAQVPVAGGNAPPMPPLPAAEAHVEAAALEAAAIEAQRQGADALLVTPHHRRWLVKRHPAFGTADTV